MLSITLPGHEFGTHARGRAEPYSLGNCRASATPRGRIFWAPTDLDLASQLAYRELSSGTRIL